MTDSIVYEVERFCLFLNAFNVVPITSDGTQKTANDDLSKHFRGGTEEIHGITIYITNIFQLYMLITQIGLTTVNNEFEMTWKEELMASDKVKFQHSTGKTGKNQ
jgi:hypothetical protein